MEAVFIQPGRRPNPPHPAAMTPAAMTLAAVTPAAGMPAAGMPAAATPAARRAAQHARQGAGGAALSSVREVSVRALDELKRAPTAVRVGLIAGISVAVLVVGVLGLVTIAGGRSTPATASATPSASAASPLIPIQEYHDADLNVTVNVPAGWAKTTNGSYVDFTDPQDRGRRLRLNVEKAGGTAQQFLGVAERGLKDPAKKTCAAPYARVDLRDVELSRQPAAELEYTCGQGDQTRHAIWRATVLGGKAYSFFVTVPAPRFAESVAIYQELVRSFRIDT
jgi:hypothetical protein